MSLPASGDAASFGHRARIELAILLALVFVGGLLTGLLVHRLRPGAGGPAVPAGHEVFFERFARDYDLDAAQRRQLRIVLEERERERANWSDNVQRSMKPEYREPLLMIHRATDRRIREILTPEQRARYEEHLARGARE